MPHNFELFSPPRISYNLTLIDSGSHFKNSFLISAPNLHSNFGRNPSKSDAELSDLRDLEAS